MTESTDPPDVQNVADQARVFALLARIAAQAPGLASGQLTIYAHVVSVHIWLETPGAFDQWREALAMPAEAVQLHSYGVHSWIIGPTVIDGVRVELHADVPLAPGAAAVSPVVDAERRDRADELQARLAAAPAPAADAPTIPIHVVRLTDAPTAVTR